MKELIIRDSDYLPIEVIDDYVSLVWADRYSAFGDFKLTYSVASDTASKITQPRDPYFQLLSHPDSEYFMFIETASLDAETNLVTATGRSLEKLTDDKINLKGLASGSYFTGDVWDYMNSLVEDQMVPPGHVSATADQLANLWTGPHPFVLATITRPHEVGTIYSALAAVSQEQDVGFRILYYTYDAFNGQDNILRFDVYTGTDRTLAQNAVDPVLFSPVLDNMDNVQYIDSTAAFKNVIWLNDAGTITEYISPDVTAYVPSDRFKKTTYADMSGIDRGTLTTPEWDAVKQGYALSQLAKAKEVHLIDGTLVPSNQFVYGTDYFLGDTVNFGSADRTVRIVEHILTVDADGERSYPTLKEVT